MGCRERQRTVRGSESVAKFLGRGSLSLRVRRFLLRIRKQGIMSFDLVGSVLVEPPGSLGRSAFGVCGRLGICQVS